MVQWLSNTPAGLTAAITLLRQGGLLIYPTETFYALGADATQAPAVARLLACKGRTAAAGLPLIAATPAVVAQWAPMPTALQVLTQRHWPGALSVVLIPYPSAPALPGVCAADGSLALRCSSQPLASALAQGLQTGGLLVATSANRHGSAPAAHCRQLEASWLARLAATDAVLDAGPLPGGQPSTLVRLSPSGTLQILRQGRVKLT